jgi:signal transduction histidine kinase
MNERWLSVSIAAFFALVASSAAWGVHHIEVETRNGIRVVLTGIVRTARHSAHVWTRRSENEAALWASMPQVRTLIEKLVKPNPGRGTETSLDRALSSELRAHSYLSYSVLSLDGSTLAGSSGLVPKDLVRLRSGPSIELPFRWKGRVAMAVTAPVLDVSGSPIAILAFFVDPSTEFSDAFRTSWSGEQIVSYAFDRNGKMLTESKLHDVLVEEKLIRPDESTILSVDLRDPGGDLSAGFVPSLSRDVQPRTDLAAHALSGGSGLNLNGYRDYRGKKVIGAWEWDPVLNMGIAAELDADSAYSSYYAARSTIFFILGILFATALTMILYLWRQSHSLYEAVGTLQTAEQSLRDEIEIRNEFISAASHELRTPLTPIQMELDLVARLGKAGTIGQFPLQKLMALNDISLRETERIKEIIQNYLDVTRMSRGRFPMMRKEFDMVQLAEEVCQRFSDAWRVGDGLIRVIAPRAVTGSWDAHRMEQVLTLLLSNATKYGQGKPVEVWVEPVDSQIKLSVVDHGPGMSKADQSKIFERFEKADSEWVLRGLGVGLYIVKRIVEDHGGTIKVQSEPTRGTTFVVVMPKVAPVGSIIAA